MKHLRCRPSIFGKDWPHIVIPDPLLNGAGSIVLARQRGGGFEPFGLRLPHQVYVKDLPALLEGGAELWALPVGVEASWIQIAGPKPGTQHPPRVKVSDSGVCT